MPILLPNSLDAAEVERRRYPAILAEVPSSSQSDEERDRTYLHQLIETADLSSYHTLEQTYVALMDELLALRAVDRGWDTYDGDVPSEATIQGVQQALLQLKRFGALPVAVRPSSDGGIGICFAAGEGYGHLEFLNRGEAYALAYAPARPPESWQIDRTEEGLHQAWEQIRAYIQP
jgi:hypothetical protein